MKKTAQPKRPAQKTASRTPRRPPKPDRGIRLKDLPVTYLMDGSRMATLREMISPKIATKPVHSLTLKQQAALVAHRLEQGQESFQMRMLGVPDVIDRKRAAREVRAMSHIGMHLIDIEKRVIRMVAELELEKQKGRKNAR